MTTLVLCMAGLYKRFRDAGYTTPKYLLPLRGKPVLSHVAAGLTGADAVLLVANRRDQAHGDAVRDAMALAGRAVDVLVHVGDTAGQAETAAIGARLASERGLSGPIAFHNVDTVVRRDLAHVGALLADADGFIDVFPSQSPAYSYVDVQAGPGPRGVTAIAEKRVISPWATTGLYAFRSPATYLDAAAAAAAPGAARPAGEFYVSDVYRQMLDRGARVVADPSLPCAVELLGTPGEYEAAVTRSAA